MERRPGLIVSQPTRVLYLIGWGRSGSTVLANILGEIEGFFSAGELHYFWERSLLEGRRCGCGEPIRSCVVWSPIVAELERQGTVDPATVTAWIRDTLRIRHTARLLRLDRGAALHPAGLASYAALLQRLYRTIAETTASSVIVDSSKIPSDAALLRLLPGVDPYYVHLVRDPRAVAWSWRRVKEQQDPNAPAVMRTHRTAESAVNWDAWNLAADALAHQVGPRRFVRVRYEDFVDRPRRTVATIAAMVGHGEAALPFEDDRTAILRPNHTVSGNPDRFRTGPVVLRDDAEWLERQAPADRIATTALTIPGLLRYGYPLRPRPLRPRAASPDS